MFTESRAFTHPISYRNRSVVLLTPNYPGLNHRIGPSGIAAQQIAGWLRQRDIRSQVIVPFNASMKSIEWDNVNSQPGFSVKHKVVEGVPVNVVHTTMDGESEYSRLQSFGKTLAHLVMEANYYTDPPALFHFLDASLGVSIGALAVSPGLRGRSVIFSPMESDHIFPLDTQELHGIDEGIFNSNIVLLWSIAHRERMSAFSQQLVHHLAHDEPKIATLNGTWDINGPIPEATLTELEAFYMERLYMRGLDRSVHFMNDGDVVVDKAAYLVSENMDPKAPSRTEPIMAAIEKHRVEIDKLVKTFVFGGAGRGGLTNDYYGNAGAFAVLLSMLNPMDPNGRYLAIPDGGYFERGGPLTYSALVEGLKGLTPEGRYALGVNCIRQTPIFFRQLPNHGQGWFIWSASDNFWMPSGTPMVGDKPLWEAQQGIILTGVETRDVKPSFGSFLVHKENGGANPKPGEIPVFAEKASRTTLDKIMANYSRTTANKNTFVFAMRVEVAKRLAELLSEPSKKDGRPLFSTYPLDISSNVICPMTLEEDEWMAVFVAMQAIRAGGHAICQITHNGLEVTELAKGMIGLEKNTPLKFDRKDDWLRIWQITQEAKTLANGLGGATIGTEFIPSLGLRSENCLWDDCGSLEAILNLWMMSLSKDPVLREIYRARAGFPSDTNIHNVTGLEKVTFVNPENGQPLPKGVIPENIFLMNVTFEDEVTIEADNVMIVDSSFGKGPKYISSNTVIADSRIGEIVGGDDQPEQMIYAPKFVYGVTAPKLVVYGGFFHTSLSLRFTEDADLTRAGLSRTDSPIAIAPIFVNLKSPLSKDQNYSYLRTHPALALLNVDQPLTEQEFIIQHPETGAPALLGMNWLQVRGGW